MVKVVLSFAMSRPAPRRTCTAHQATTPSARSTHREEQPADGRRVVANAGPAPVGPDRHRAALDESVRRVSAIALVHDARRPTRTPSSSTRSLIAWSRWCRTGVRRRRGNTGQFKALRVHRQFAGIGRRNLLERLRARAWRTAATGASPSQITERRGPDCRSDHRRRGRAAGNLTRPDAKLGLQIADARA